MQLLLKEVPLKAGKRTAGAGDDRRNLYGAVVATYSIVFLSWDITMPCYAMFSIYSKSSGVEAPSTQLQDTELL